MVSKVSLSTQKFYQDLRGKFGGSGRWELVSGVRRGYANERKERKERMDGINKNQPEEVYNYRMCFKK